MKLSDVFDEVIIAANQSDKQAVLSQIANLSCSDSDLPAVALLRSDPVTVDEIDYEADLVINSIRVNKTKDKKEKSGDVSAKAFAFGGGIDVDFANERSSHRATDHRARINLKAKFKRVENKGLKYVQEMLLERLIEVNSLKETKGHNSSG